MPKTHKHSHPCELFLLPAFSAGANRNVDSRPASFQISAETRPAEIQHLYLPRQDKAADRVTKQDSSARLHSKGKIE